MVDKLRRPNGNRIRAIIGNGSTFSSDEDRILSFVSANRSDLFDFSSAEEKSKRSERFADTNDSILSSSELNVEPLPIMARILLPLGRRSLSTISLQPRRAQLIVAWCLKARRRFWPMIALFASIAALPALRAPTGPH